MINILKVGDEARLAFNSVEGVISSQKWSGAYSLILEFLDKDLMLFFEQIKNDLNCKAYNIVCKFSGNEQENKTLNFKELGKDYPDKVKEFKKLFEQGEELFLEQKYFKVSEVFKSGILAFNNKIRITKTDEENLSNEFERCLNIKSEIREFLTEVLKLNITPELFAGDNHQLVRVIITDCKERDYDCLKNNLNLLFKNCWFGVSVIPKSQAKRGFFKLSNCGIDVIGDFVFKKINIWKWEFILKINNNGKKRCKLIVRKT